MTKAKIFFYLFLSILSLVEGLKVDRDHKILADKSNRPPPPQQKAEMARYVVHESGNQVDVRTNTKILTIVNTMNFHIIPNIYHNFFKWNYLISSVYSMFHLPIELNFKDFNSKQIRRI